MKKTFVCVAVASCIALLSGCGAIGSGSATSNSNGSILGGIIGAASSANTIGNVIGSVLGTNKLTAKQLVGTWKYKGPGCAFTSDNALAKAGGEIAATQIKEELATQYSKLGFTSSNTYITFNEDGTYSAKIDGKQMTGKYTFDESSCQFKLTGLLLSFTGYAKKNTDGIGILFESKKILSLIQTLSSMSGNETVNVIGDISKNYDGVRVGFDMTK